MNITKWHFFIHIFIGTSKSHYNLEDDRDVELLLNLLENGEFSDIGELESDEDEPEQLENNNITRIGSEQLGIVIVYVCDYISIYFSI